MCKKLPIVIGFFLCIVFSDNTVMAQNRTDPTLYFDKTPKSNLIKTCDYCGMDREKFSHSRMLITYDDLSEFGACSISCAAMDLAIRLDKTPKCFHVGDYSTKKLIDAELAFWVIGGSRPGVMSSRGIWAFERKVDAEAFVKGNGGTITGFDDAIVAAYENMYMEGKIARERRKAAQMQKKSPEHGH